MTIFLVIGFVGLAPSSNTGAQWAIGSLLLVFIFVYDCTVGPITYCLVAEIPSTRLRQKSVALARSTYNVGSIVCNVLVTRQLNPSAWNWSAKAGFFWAGSCALCFIWAFFRLPEPKGRTYVELDMLFDRKVSARTFASVRTEELVMDDASEVAVTKTATVDLVEDKQTTILSR